MLEAPDTRVVGRTDQIEAPAAVGPGPGNDADRLIRMHETAPLFDVKLMAAPTRSGRDPVGPSPRRLLGLAANRLAVEPRRPHLSAPTRRG